MPIVAYASIIGPRYEETRFMEASPVKGESDEAATAVRNHDDGAARGAAMFCYQVLACYKDTLAEWLRRRPAKPMGSPRVGSNPTGVDCLP